MFGNSTLSPEMLMALGGGIMQGSNLGTGMGQGFQNAATVMGQQKEQAAVKDVENKTRAWLQQKYPGEDFSTMTPDMMKVYASETLKQKFAQADIPALAQEYNFAKQQGFTGSFMDYQKNKATLDSKPPADYQNYQMMQSDPGYAEWAKQQQAAKDAPTSKDKMAAEMDTRKTYRAEPNVKTYQTVKTAYQKGRQAAAMDSAAGDMSLVYAFMKMQDPESVVREGEYATAEKAGSVQDWVVNIYNRVRTGQRLTAQQKADFVKAMDEQYTIASGALEDTNKQYEPYIDEFGLPKERLITQPEKFEPLDLKSLGDGQTVTTKDKSGNPVTIQKLPEQ